MVKDSFRNDRGSMFKSMKSSLIKAMSLNPFSRVPSKSEAASDKPKAESLAHQGTRLLAMVKQLQLLSADSSTAIHQPQLLPKAAQVLEGPRESAPPSKRLFSATDLQAVSLRGNAKTLAAPTAPAPAVVKSKLLPFSALDLSKVQLKRKTAGGQGQGQVQGQVQGQGQIKATPLHEQLKRALQRKFMKVRATPTPGPGQSDVAEEEWD